MIDLSIPLPVLSAIFILTLCRVSALIMAAPGFGESTSPMVVRAGLAITISVLIMPVVQPQLEKLATHILTSPTLLVVAVGQELLVGIFIGWIAKLVALSLVIAMQFIATFTGLASVLQPDPDLGASSTAISHMASSLIPVLFLTTGLYVLPLAALTGSYSVFPPGEMPLVNDMAKALVISTALSFKLGFQYAAPFVLIGTLWPAMLGVLNRLMPSIQVYGIAMPAQLLGGVLLIALLIQVITGVWQERMQEALSELPGIHGQR
ncbi:flagellar biosynthetic protein FliR [Asaia astilbis]|uniref:flagellar biosynthetic protein FliR n=1 Tax=Asaia astilbis TaxID=610244 RepID=UPI00056A362E|nr:flagellar biosynthetic protein FliR [Asaia astilbis]